MFKLFGNYLKRHIPEILLNLLFMGLQVFLQVFLILRQMKVVIDQGIATGSMDQIVRSCALMAAYTVLAILCTVVTANMSGRIVSGVVRDIRHDCMKNIYALSTEDYHRFGSASLVTRIMSDVIQLETLLINLTRSSMMVFFAILAMMLLIFMTNALLASILFAAFFIANAFMVRRAAQARPFFERIQTLTERMNRLFFEKLTGARTIRAYRNEAFEAEKIAAVSADVLDANLEANRPLNFASPIVMIIMNWTALVIYLIGARQVQASAVSLSDLLLVINYLSYFISSFSVISVIVNLVPKVHISSARIIELLTCQPTWSAGTVKEGIGGAEIEYRAVTFAYSDAVDAVSQISFRAEAGKTTAIIGGTGSGKTTLMNLLQGMLHMTSGDILIDGLSIKAMDPAYLLGKISYAPQKPMIFQDTIQNNLTAYNDAVSEARVQQALAAACFDEVVQQLPHGLETPVTQGGMNLSGGQRQRLSLARALARDAAIYIIDDSLSALDSLTEQRVRQNMRTLLAGRTTLLISQKISAVREADHIIVMDNGGIVGDGTHETLLENCPTYREIYEIQCYNEDQKHG